MIEVELEKAFATLTQALTLTESETSEEIGTIQEQIIKLKEQIIELTGRQQALVHDRESISDMFNRYSAN